jgi:hypothetical protein
MLLEKYNCYLRALFYFDNIHELLTPRGLAFQIGMIISSNSLCSGICGGCNVELINPRILVWGNY